MKGLNLGNVKRAALNVVSPRKREPEAVAAEALLKMEEPPLDRKVAQALTNCGHGGFVDGRQLAGLTTVALGEIGRLLAKHRQGNALAWLYLRRQRDQVGGAKTLHLNVRPASSEFLPEDKDRLTGKDVKFIGQWLQAWKPALETLIAIDLSGHAIDESGLKHLDEILPGIERLNLRGNIFHDKISNSFYRALAQAADLKEADLSVKGVNWEKLCKALQSSELRKLVISREDGKTGHQAEIWSHCHLLLGSQHIQHLDLSGQQLFEPTATLTTALKKNLSLTQLILRGCFTRAAACLDFIAAIGSHDTLQVANLAGLPLNECCSKLAARLLSTQCSLHTLDLSLIRPEMFGERPLETDPEYRGLFTHFPKNTTLRSVNIAGHPLNVATQEALVKALETSQLQSLDARGCGVSVKLLSEAILKSHSLIEVHAEGLDDCEAAPSIRERFELNLPEIKSAGHSLQLLSPVALPAELALSIALWNLKKNNDPTDLQKLAAAGRWLPPQSSSRT